jgi:DNA-binding winged helix-turn-helix (wHTH) protein
MQEMQEQPSASRPFEFAGYRADPATNELLCLESGLTSRLEPRTMHVLCLLAAKPGDVISREHFAEAVWPGRKVVADSLSQCISELRKELGDNPKNPSFIRTVPKRGYSFLPLVTWLPAPSAASSEAATSAERPGRRRHRFLALFTLLLLGISVVLWAFLDENTLASGGASRSDVERLMPLLSRESGQPDRLRWASERQAEKSYVIERDWLDGDRVHLRLRDETGDVVWSVARAAATTKERRAAAEQLGEAVALADTQVFGSILGALTPEQRLLFKRAQHHLHRRTEADLFTARDLIDELLAAQPDFIEGILLLAELQLGLSRHDRSVTGPIGYRDAHDALVARAARLAPDHPAVKARRFDPGQGQIDWQRSEEELRALVAQAPDCTPCVRRLGNFYVQVGWYSDALRVWEQHKRYWPVSVSVHATIARLHTRLGNAREALREVRLIRALAGGDAWDVRAAELDAYQILGDRERWIDGARPLLASLGPRGEARLKVLDAALQGDSARLEELAEDDRLDVQSISFSLVLGRIDEVAATIESAVNDGKLDALGEVHGHLREANALSRYYVEGLDNLRAHPRIQALFDSLGLQAFWRERGRFPDYCSGRSRPAPYCA